MIKSPIFFPVGLLSTPTIQGWRTSTNRYRLHGRAPSRWRARANVVQHKRRFGTNGEARLRQSDGEDHADVVRSYRKPFSNPLDVRVCRMCGAPCSRGGAALGWTGKSGRLRGVDKAYLADGYTASVW